MAVDLIVPLLEHLFGLPRRTSTFLLFHGNSQLQPSPLQQGFLHLPLARLLHPQCGIFQHKLAVSGGWNVAQMGLGEAQANQSFCIGSTSMTRQGQAAPLQCLAAAQVQTSLSQLSAMVSVWNINELCYICCHKASRHGLSRPFLDLMRLQRQSAHHPLSKAWMRTRDDKAALL